MRENCAVMAVSTTRKKKKCNNGGSSFWAVGQSKTQIGSETSKTGSVHSSDRVREVSERKVDRYRRKNKKGLVSSIEWCKLGAN